MTEEIVRDIFKTTVDAIAHCHENGIAHLDIKPENILVNIDNRKCLVTDLRIADFGMSCENSEEVIDQKN